MPSFDPLKDIPNLTGKVIFITGGTSGIGRAAVLSLAPHQPAHIYFTGRNAKSASTVVAEARTQAPDCKVTFVPCDLAASRETIRQALVDHFHSSRLDIFIANAGIMAVPPGLTTEGYEVQFGTNHLGHAILLRLLRPLMFRTTELPDGGDVRLVMLSSAGHMMHPEGGIQFDSVRTPDAGSVWQMYGQSKLANILYAKAMAKHYPRITSVSVHPGLVDTGLGDGVEPSMWFSLLKSLRWLPIYRTSEQGAYNALWCATTFKDKLENGAYYEPVGKKTGVSWGFSGHAKICDDEGLADKLWVWTEKELEDLHEL